MNMHVGSAVLVVEPGCNIANDDRGIKNGNQSIILFDGRSCTLCLILVLSFLGAFVGHNLVHNYLSLVLSAFVHHGFVEALGKVSQYLYLYSVVLVGGERERRDKLDSYSISFFCLISWSLTLTLA
jgi:hypothetical protein